MTEQQTASALANEVERFLRSFKDREGSYKYFDKINHMMSLNSTSIVVDYIDFDISNPDFAKQITHNPDEIFVGFNQAVLSILSEIHTDYATEIRDKLRVRIGNYTVQKGLREISAEVIDKLNAVFPAWW